MPGPDRQGVERGLTSAEAAARLAWGPNELAPSRRFEPLKRWFQEAAMTAPVAIRQILFPTDFSDASRLAAATAGDMARHFGARLHVLHVVPPVTDPTTAPAALRAAVEELGPGLSIVTAIVSGVPARQIVAYARKNTIDLIVLGTHGRTGVSRTILGSVAEAVVRRALCRVLTVPAELPSATARPEVAEPEEATSCLVCGAAVRSELICEPCRARIRGEALEHKRREERGR